MTDFKIGQKVVYKGHANADPINTVQGTVVEVLGDGFYKVDFSKRDHKNICKVFRANLFAQ